MVTYIFLCIRDHKIYISNTINHLLHNWRGLAIIFYKYFTIFHYKAKLKVQFAEIRHPRVFFFLEVMMLRDFKFNLPTKNQNTHIFHVNVVQRNRQVNAF